MYVRQYLSSYSVNNMKLSTSGDMNSNVPTILPKATLDSWVSSSLDKPKSISLHQNQTLKHKCLEKSNTHFNDKDSFIIILL